MRGGRIRMLAGMLAAALLIAGLAAQGAVADDGDLVSSFDASETAGVPYCPVSTSLAYDGEGLLVSCWHTNTVYRVHPETQQLIEVFEIDGAADLGAMAYDAGRDALWVCDQSVTIRKVDMATRAVDDGVPPITAECTDGLAYDGEDDTLWASGDAHGYLTHLALDGTILGQRDVYELIGYCGNSGIAVGGDKLYLANNGCQEIWEVEKDFSASRLFTTLDVRIEDLECDASSFGGQGVIWSQDAYDRVLNAWEMPPDLCSHGGGIETAAGEAYTARATVAGYDTGLVGAARSSGGDADGQVAGQELPGGAGTVSAGRTTATSSVDEARAQATSTASVARADLVGASSGTIALAGGVVVAEGLVASAHVSIDGDAGTTDATADGTSIASLTVAGQPVALPVPPNTTIPVPGVGTLTVFETVDTTSAEGLGRSMTVNALRLRSDDGATDIVVASATAAVGRETIGEPPTPSLPDPQVPEVTTFIHEDFEGEADGWTIEDAGEVSPVWELGEPTSGPGSAVSGDRVAGTNLAGQLARGADSRLVSPTVDLSRLTPGDLELLGKKVVLRYQQWFQGDWYGYDCGYLVAQAATADVLLQPDRGYPVHEPWCDDHYPAGAYANDLSGGGWTTVEVDLTSFAGQQFELAWQVHSPSFSFVYGPAAGWYVDDVVVDLVDAPAPSASGGDDRGAG